MNLSDKYETEVNIKQYAVFLDSGVMVRAKDEAEAEEKARQEIIDLILNGDAEFHVEEEID